MNQKTTSLAILLAACIAVALTAMTSSPALAQCGPNKDQPCDNEKERKPTRTDVPPTATFTPTREPTATPTPAPTATPTDVPGAAAVVPPAPFPEEDRPQAGGWWLPAAAVLLLIGVITAARRALGAPKIYTADLDGQLDVAPDFEFTRDDVRATFNTGQGATSVSTTKTPSRRLTTNAELGPHALGPLDLGGNTVEGDLPPGNSVDLDAEVDLVPDFHIEKEDVRVELSADADLRPGAFQPIPIPQAPAGLGDLDLPNHDATKDTLPIEGDLADSAEHESADASDEDSSDDDDEK